MIGLPPFDDGAAHDTVDEEFSPEVAVTDFGPPGVVAGVTAFDGAEAKPLPTLLLATTVKV